jgi:hypothetical protein
MIAEASYVGQSPHGCRRGRRRDRGGDAPAPSLGAAARDRRFSALLVGKVASSMGVWAQNLVAAILAFQVSGPAFMVSVVQVAPQIVLTPLSGKLLDFGYGRSQLILGRGLCAVGSAPLAIWAWSSPVEEATMWPLLAASCLIGVGFSIGGPALQSVAPRIVRSDELGVAHSPRQRPDLTVVGARSRAGRRPGRHGAPAVTVIVAGATRVAFIVALLLLDLPLHGSGALTATPRSPPQRA